MDPMPGGGGLIIIKKIQCRRWGSYYIKNGPTAGGGGLIKIKNGSNAGRRGVLL